MNLLKVMILNFFVEMSKVLKLWGVFKKLLNVFGRLNEWLKVRNIMIYVVIKVERRKKKISEVGICYCKMGFGWESVGWFLVFEFFLRWSLLLYKICNMKIRNDNIFLVNFK